MDAYNDESWGFHQEKGNNNDEDPGWMDYLPELYKLLSQRASLDKLCIEKHCGHK